MPLQFPSTVVCMIRGFIAQFLFLSAIYTWKRCSADQIIYLERPSWSETNITEPVFNPNSVTASPGEIIHFVARFGDQTPYLSKVITISSRRANQIRHRISCLRSCGLLPNLITIILVHGMEA